MKIVDNTGKSIRPSALLNDIPVGQVFRGTIIGPVSKLPTSGIFYKAYGPSSIRGRVGSGFGEKTADVIVVRLDATWSNHGFANCFLRCSEVKEYEPLNASLVITEAK